MSVAVPTIENGIFFPLQREVESGLVVLAQIWKFTFEFARGPGWVRGSAVCWEGLNQASLGEACGGDGTKEDCQEIKASFSLLLGTQRMVRNT